MVCPPEMAGEDDEDVDASRWLADARDMEGCRDWVGPPALTDSNLQSFPSLLHVTHLLLS